MTHKTGVINDPLGQTHSLASSERCFLLLCVASFWKVGTYGRHPYPYRPWVWVGRVDQKMSFSFRISWRHLTWKLRTNTYQYNITHSRSGINHTCAQGGIPPLTKNFINPPPNFFWTVCSKKETNFFTPPPPGPIAPCTCMVLIVMLAETLNTMHLHKIIFPFLVILPSFENAYASYIFCVWSFPLWSRS